MSAVSRTSWDFLESSGGWVGGFGNLRNERIDFTHGTLKVLAQVAAKTKASTVVELGDRN